MQSGFERNLEFQIKALKLPAPETQYRFHPTRRWTFDFCWPDLKLALEVEGGIWTKGRHTRGKGYEKDCEKYNEAALAGFRLLRVTTDMVKAGTALNVVERAIQAAQNEAALVDFRLLVASGRPKG
jgi:very-short-patch-repair endonuclease